MLLSQDGAVLLAKYLEHQASAIARGSIPRHQHQHRHQRRHDFHDPRRHETQPDNAERLDGQVDTFLDSNSEKPDNINTPHEENLTLRVLELGCGTGLAGLAAAVALGKGNHTQRDGVLPYHRHPPLQPSQGDQDCLCQQPHQGEHPGKGIIGVREAAVEVVLTDLSYALTNARTNIARNAEALEAVGAHVTAIELDWCRPLPPGLVGEAHSPDFRMRCECYLKTATQFVRLAIRNCKGARR